MKKLLLILSVILFGCSQNRVLQDELTSKGTKESPLMYYESELFNGIGFNVYENAQLKEEGSYKDGKMVGLWKEYYDSGEIMKESQYETGKKEGSFRYYYKNAQLKEEGSYKDGKMVGLWKKYYDSGEIMKESQYETGKIIKESSWDEDGNEIKQIKNITCYDFYDNSSRYLGDIIRMTAIYFDDWNAYMTPNTVNDLGRYKKAGLSGRVPGARRSDGTLKNWAKPDKMYQIESITGNVGDANGWANCYVRKVGCKYSQTRSQCTNIYIPEGTPLPRDESAMSIIITGEVFVGLYDDPCILVHSIERR